MKATNQGFIDLHTPLGFFVIGTAFLVLSAIIICGAIYGKSIGAKDREMRRQMKEDLKNHDTKLT
jgi:hypothetical protein